MESRMTALLEEVLYGVQDHPLSYVSWIRHHAVRGVLPDRLPDVQRARNGERRRADEPAGSFLFALDKQRVVPIQERTGSYGWVEGQSRPGCARKSESQAHFHEPLPRYY